MFFNDVEIIKPPRSKEKVIFQCDEIYFKTDAIAQNKKLKKFNEYWSKLKPTTITNLKRAGIDKNEAKDRYVMGPGLGLRVNLWQMKDKVVVDKGQGDRAKQQIAKNKLEREKFKKKIQDTITDVKNKFSK